MASLEFWGNAGTRTHLGRQPSCPLRPDSSLVLADCQVSSAHVNINLRVSEADTAHVQGNLPISIHSLRVCSVLNLRRKTARITPARAHFALSQPPSWCEEAARIDQPALFGTGPTDPPPFALFPTATRQI